MLRGDGAVQPAPHHPQGPPGADPTPKGQAGLKPFSSRSAPIATLPPGKLALLPPYPTGTDLLNLQVK